MNETGIVRLGVPGAPVSLGNLAETRTLLALFCLFTIVLMTIRRIPGAIVTGVLGTTFLSFLLNVTPAPVRWIGVPPDVRPLLLKVSTGRGREVPAGLWVLAVLFLVRPTPWEGADARTDGFSDDRFTGHFLNARGILVTAPRHTPLATQK
ncbi:hypothetical protein K0B90_05880 [bacterium]|nr:hypothetical protein [bacterium]